MKYKKLSKYGQILIFLTFFLPFFPTGCKKVAVEAPSIDTIAANTDALKYAVIDSIPQNVQPIAAIDSVPADHSGNETSERTITKKVISFIFFPGENVSGCFVVFAGLVDFFQSQGIIFAFFLWLFVLVIKWRDFNTVFLPMQALGLISFLLHCTDKLVFFNGESRLWGYWVCAAWVLLLLIYDGWYWLKSRMKKQGRD